MGRKKPTPTTLFDNSERSNDGYMKRAEGLYKFLNRCARPEWEEVRRETERWYAESETPRYRPGPQALACVLFRSTSHGIGGRPEIP